MSDIMGSIPREVLEMRLAAVTRQAALLREAMSRLIGQHHSGRWTSQFDQGEDVTAVVAEAVRFPATMADAIWAIQLHAEAAASEDALSVFTVSELAEDGLATGSGSPGEQAALTRLLGMAVAAIDADDPLAVDQVLMLTRAGVLDALQPQPAATLGIANHKVVLQRGTPSPVSDVEGP